MELSPQVDWTDVALTPSLYLSGFGRDAQNGSTAAKDYGDGFREISPAFAGENLTRIHWPSFVRDREVLLKRFDQPLSHEIWILLDETGSMCTGAQWMFSRQLGVRIAAGALKARHKVRLLVEREGELLHTPVLTTLASLINVWHSFLSKPPSGEGAAPEVRSRLLQSLPVRGHIIVLSDGLYTYSSKEDSLQLGQINDQFAGALNRALCSLYLCIIDPEADEPPQDPMITSPERTKQSILNLPLQQRSQLKTSLNNYRKQQHTLFEQRVGCTWCTCLVSDSISMTFKKIAEIMMRPR